MIRNTLIVHSIELNNSTESVTMPLYHVLKHQFMTQEVSFVQKKIFCPHTKMIDGCEVLLVKALLWKICAPMVLMFPV
jgi:hypothetical protein